MQNNQIKMMSHAIFLRIIFAIFGFLCADAYLYLVGTLASSHFALYAMKQGVNPIHLTIFEIFAPLISIELMLIIICKVFLNNDFFVINVLFWTAFATKIAG
jgi:hypothetical protein